jgi:hypothetical protein
MQPRPDVLDRAERAALRRLRELIREGQHPRPAGKQPAPKPPKSNAKGSA